ncbi:MAG: tRNA lysidine(34) synthetase TilS [Polyangiaceae bacterium]|nr:tRNA lysidine(34) synthetase TilS [Myxococcales bacterium]MCB9590058.1 tRNA lysidine(34) synthetase TilS [Polyangiaceae bacterium]
MSRSHPPTLIKLVQATLKDLDLRGARLLVAVSGGPDSMALLHVLALSQQKLGLRVWAHGVDHGLRGEAGAELDLAQALAEAHGVAFTRSRISLPKGGNLQERARVARYRELEAVAQHHEALVCTAHHADDRAETLLLRLLRGSGPGGLAVLPPRSGDRVRPMIRATRGDVLRHVERHALQVASDPSNADPRFLRVRVRRELLPLLEQLSPGIVGHLTALADQLGEESALRGGLNRAQVQALQHALIQQQPVELALKGGQTLKFAPESASGTEQPSRGTRGTLSLRRSSK